VSKEAFVVADDDTDRGGSIVRDHHRRCVSAVVNLLILSGRGDGDPLPSRTVREMNEATARSLDELRGAMKRVIEALAAVGLERPAVEVLEGRFTRTETAAAEISLALSSGDLSLARRHVQQFRALVSAMWKIQLDLYGSAVRTADGARAARPARRSTEATARSPVREAAGPLEPAGSAWGFGPSL
jgi:hypothetical protein